MRQLTISRTHTVQIAHKAPSLNDMFRDVIRTIHPPQKRANGRQALANQKVRDGRVRAAGPLEDTLLDEHEAGTDLVAACAKIGSTLMQWALAVTGKAALRRDVRTAVLAEQAAQCACDVEQMELLTGADRATKERLLPKLYWHRETLTALIAALESDLVSDEQGRDITRRRLAEMTGAA